MKVNGKSSLALAALIFGISAGTTLKATAISQTYTGTLTQESGSGSVFLTSFTLTSASTLTLYTTSYGGGANLNGTTTTHGGFEPNVTLYNSTGFTIANQGVSFSPIANPDPTNGWKGDSYLLDPNLAAGTYYLTVTDWQNQESITANTINLSNPASSFSGPGGTSFMDVQGNNRTGSYALNISATPLAPTSTPEPATLGLVLPVLAGAIVFLRKRRPSLV